jgi:CheY-like chemotaxis protein
LFESLLDMTKLEAGILQPSVAEFPVSRLLERVETTFAEAARKKGLGLSVVRSDAWVASDPILLERILLNLVSNAVRYTEHGGVLVGCRCRGDRLRIDVYDTGPGIPEDQQSRVFGEYYQLGAAEMDRRSTTGLGLGLAIVERLGRLLGHPVELRSRPGRGSRFSIIVPYLAGRRDVAEVVASPITADPARGKLVVIIDDDPLVLEGMSGLLRSWGCAVASGDNAGSALSKIEAAQQQPALIVSDYRLANGESGIDTIRQLRERFDRTIPALLISGDTAPDRLREADQAGFRLLHKPVAPMRLRALVNQLLMR